MPVAVSRRKLDPIAGRRPLVCTPTAPTDCAHPRSLAQFTPPKNSQGPDVPQRRMTGSPRSARMGSMKRSEAAGVVPVELASYGRPISSVFDLLGRRETDLTAALGWVLARSRRLRDRFLDRCALPIGGDIEAVRLETADVDGRTDIELVREGALVVIEAKRGWQLPTVRQLATYSKRVVAAGGGMLITLSDASPAWAAHALPGVVDGVPVQHLPWSVVLDDIHAAASDVRGSERRWLGELRSYLRKAVHVHDPASGWAYCVVVSDATPDWGGDGRTASTSSRPTRTSIRSVGARAGLPSRRTSWRSGIEAM